MTKDQLMVGPKIQKNANESIQRTKDQRVVNMLMKQHLRSFNYTNLLNLRRLSFFKDISCFMHYHLLGPEEAV